MKKAICVVTHENYSYPVRVKYLEQLLISKGYDVTVLSSDFDHRTKEYYKNDRDGLVLLHVKPYRKNFSINRMLSHIDFAKKSKKYIEKQNPDFVFASGAPNSVYKYISKYKKKHESTKLVFDVTDLWPETLPISGILKRIATVPLYLWKNIRIRSLKYADYTFFECDMFQELIRKDNRSIQGKTVYLCEDDCDYSILSKAFDDEMNLLYLGSINNIIDINMIAAIVQRICSEKKVVLNIIGDGEKKNELLEAVENSGGKCIFHGSVYDNHVKAKIFEKCDFALNIMKDTVCVGATMKSIEYFRAGLPLINNISGDTKKMILDYACGVNITYDNLKDTINTLLNFNSNDIKNMRMNSREVYCRYFSPDAFRKVVEPILDELGV